MIFAPVLASNAMLLIGLLWLGWSPGTVAVFFWLEAAAAGLQALVRVTASLPGASLAGPERMSYARLPKPGGRTRVSSSVPRVSPLLAVPLFVLLYGLLLLAYAASLLYALGDFNYPRLAADAWASSGARLAAALIAVEQGMLFWREFLRAPAWQRSDPTFHFWRPFGLAALLWLAFIVGFVLLGWLRTPLVLLTILILLKAAAQCFAALVDAQAGEWRPAGDAARGP